MRAIGKMVCEHTKIYINEKRLKCLPWEASGNWRKPISWPEVSEEEARLRSCNLDLSPRLAFPPSLQPSGSGNRGLEFYSFSSISSPSCDYIFLIHLLWTHKCLSAPITLLKMKVAQSCPTLCNPTDYKIHGILQARILEWVAIPFSRVSSHLRDWSQVSLIAGGFFTSWSIREARLRLLT